MSNEAPTPYSTLEAINRRKEELKQQMQRDSSKIEKLWNGVFVKHENTSRGDYISTIISNGILAVDAFLMFRKLRKNYNGVMGIFKKKKSKR